MKDQDLLERPTMPMPEEPKEPEEPELISINESFTLDLEKFEKSDKQEEK